MHDSLVQYARIQIQYDENKQNKFKPSFKKKRKEKKKNKMVSTTSPCTGVQTYHLITDQIT